MSASREERALRRQARDLQRTFGAKMAGRTRGPDWRPNTRCVPRAESVDIEDPAAQVFRPIGDGTPAAGYAWIDAWLTTAARWSVTQRLRARAQRIEAGLKTAADVKRWNAQEEARFNAERYAWNDARLRGRHAPKPRKSVEMQPPGWRGPFTANTLMVFAAVLRGHWFCFRTGRLDPAMSQLEKVTGFPRQTIVNALRALRESGFLLRVRRTVRVDEPGGGSRRVQTNNAYHFNLAGLPRAARMMIAQMIERARRRRATPGAPAPAPASPKPRQPQNSALRDAIEALGRSIQEPSPAK